MRLSDLKTGEEGYIVKVYGQGSFKRRILEMGFIKGQKVKSILNAPLKDPIKYKIMDFEISLRKDEARLIEISKDIIISEKDKYNNVDDVFINKPEDIVVSDRKQKVIALIGNPNTGKTSLFNISSGSREHVANYTGVTIDSKEAKIKHKGTIFKIVDLPGIYSLSAYSPEEIYTRKFIQEEKPDIIINIVSASSIERNLYLTTELIELGIPIVIALNMYDELKDYGQIFDYERFASIVNIPCVPTIAKKNVGISQLLDQVVSLVENQNKTNISKVPYGRVLEKSISIIERELSNVNTDYIKLPTRYLSIKLLEGDNDICKQIKKLKTSSYLFERRDKEQSYIMKLLKEDCDDAFTNARYNFISESLSKTLSKKNNIKKTSKYIDRIVTNKYIGFPLFIIFMWIMFESTFIIGEVPKDMLQNLFDYLGDVVRNIMPNGPLKDLIAGGIIGGIGSVIVFLPNIVILYMFIAFIEDSGYMSRAAFIMDKLMKKIGLNGKAFIPLLMGFGCNVPAIMSSRTIEGYGNRMITMFIIPFMSCSARFPVYILFVGIFFSKYSGLVMLGLYLLGILVAIFTAIIFRKVIFKQESIPFLIELPPYRMPTLKSILLNMCEKSMQYLKKMGGTILIASIIIWMLGYFPIDTNINNKFDKKIQEIESLHLQNKISQKYKDSISVEIEKDKNLIIQENSYIGKIGKAIGPIMAPLGFDWKMSVSLLSGMAAKEIVISTMGVLYHSDADNANLEEKIKSETYANGFPKFTPLVTIGFLIFVLIYFPCIATITAIKTESKSWKWALFNLFYSTFLAWIVSFVVYQIGKLFI